MVKRNCREVFGLECNWRHKALDIWQRYKTALKNNGHYSYDFIDLVVATGMAKRFFRTSEELINWFRENQKWVIQVWKKINYGK